MEKVIAKRIEKANAIFKDLEKNLEFNDVFFGVPMHIVGLQEKFEVTVNVNDCDMIDVAEQFQFMHLLNIKNEEIKAVLTPQQLANVFLTLTATNEG